MQDGEPQYTAQQAAAEAQKKVEAMEATWLLKGLRAPISGR